MNPINRNSLIFLLLICTSCAVLKQGTQGIEGQVTWLEGNQMPKISDEKTEETNPDGTPIQRVILVYPLTNLEDAKMENGLFQSIATDPILEIETNAEGKFSIELDPGNYSIFTQEEDGIFANSFDVEGNIQPVTIKSGKWQTLNIKINYKAYY